MAEPQWRWVDPSISSVLSRWHAFDEEGRGACGLVNYNKGGYPPEAVDKPPDEGWRRRILIKLGIRKPVVCLSCKSRASSAGRASDR